MSTIPKAVATGRFGVVTQAIVTGMAVDERSGRVRGVTYLKGCGPFQDPLVSERAPPGRWYAYLAGPYYAKHIILRLAGGHRDRFRF